MSLIEGPTEKLPAHRPGCVVVAAGSKGTIALEGNTRLTWGERVFGKYNSFYQVEIGSKSYRTSFKSESARPSLEFEVTIELTFRVVDAAGAVRRGLTDPEMIFSAAVRRATRRCTQECEVDMTARARDEIEKAILALSARAAAGLPSSSDNGRGVDPAIEILDVTSEVRPDERAIELLRKVDEQAMVQRADTADSKVQEARRRIIADILKDPDQILAQTIATKDPAFQDALRFKIEQMGNDIDKQMELFQFLVSKQLIQEHDIHEKYGDIGRAAFAALAKMGWDRKIDDTPALEADKKINNS